MSCSRPKRRRRRSCFRGLNLANSKITNAAGLSIDEYFDRIKAAAVITEGDVLFALANQALRIQERTITGVDYRGQAFAPYSTHGKYYHAPGRGRSLRTRQGLALHHARYYADQGAKRKRGGTTVRYESYAHYKAATGNGVVDLGGMEGSLLPSIQVRANGAIHDISTALTVGIDSYPSPCVNGAIGIYPLRESTIALAHNNGVPAHHLPQREFMGISDEDHAEISQDVANRVQARLRKADRR